MSNRSKSEIIKLIQYSESLESKVAENSIEALRSLIDQGEAISHLVQYYSQTQSFRALDLLCRIKEPHDTELCNRLQECLDKKPLAAIILLGQIVQKSPSWLAKFADHPLFSHILKLVHTSQNTVIVVSGLLFISSLLPHCSTLKRTVLYDLFRVLLSACAMLHKRKKLLEKDSNDCFESVYVSHLYCAITQYFVVLYGIYPSNLLQFLRDKYAKPGDRGAFGVLESVFSSVKFHPQLLKMSAEQEIDRSRWSQREAHDFLADCRHVLVRPSVAINTSNVARKGYLSPCRSAKSSANYPPQMRDSTSLLSSSHSSSNNQSTESNWEDIWSPSVNLGLETPPETRSATPVVQRTNTLSNITIVPGSVGSRRSTDCSDELRRSRRSSFGQKIADFVRGRRPGELCEAKDQEHRAPVSLASTKEETEDVIEVIDVSGASVNRRDSEVGHVEEGEDATEACISPSPTVSIRTAQEEAQSPILTPTTLVASETEPNMRCGEGLDQDEAIIAAALPRSRSVSFLGTVAKSQSIEHSFDSPLQTDASQERVASEATDLEYGNDGFGGADCRNNRFSVSSFFRAVNRQRFISECPPPDAVITANASGQVKRRVVSSALKRTVSCPELVKGMISASAQRSSDKTVTQGTSAPAVTAAKISEVIEKEFPYLGFLRALPLAIIDEDAMDAELEKEHEKTREGYMEASLAHHICLKQLALADRLPAKIYDDMTNFMQGLSLEKQRDLLSTRLALVNQHLLYERCGRLLHAERNRRLFGRIKQQKLSDAEKISLQKALHGAQVEREQLVSALTELRKQGKIEKRRYEEAENRFRDELKKSRSESERYIFELERMGRRVEQLTEINEQMQYELDTVKRRCENAEVQFSLAEAKIAELENMRPELQKAHRANQELRDKITLLEIRAKSTSKASELSAPVDRDEQQLQFQISQLRADLKKERNAKDSAKAKVLEIEEEWKREKQRCIDLKMMLERAATVHNQQSDAAQHKYLSLFSVCQKQQSHILDLNTYIEKLSNSHRNRCEEGTPLAIPRSTVPDEILSYDSSQCGSENTSMFPADLFSTQGSSTNGSLFREMSNSSTVMIPSDNKEVRYRLQSGTL